MIAGQLESHGSVGVGFGQTIKRHEEHYKLYAKDLKYPNVLKAKLNVIGDYYNFQLPPDSFKNYMEDIKIMLSVSNIKIKVPEHSGDMIFEGAQGILLDQSFGFFPYVTRSNTTALNTLGLLPAGVDPTVYMVTRAYTTRHGKGPMGNWGDITLKNNEKETNKKHAYQGEFRTGKFIEDFAKVVVMTCCDQVEEIPKLNTRHTILYNSSEEGNFFKKRQLFTDTYYE
jgi:adenylosuccinate synthase